MIQGIYLSKQRMRAVNGDISYNTIVDFLKLQTEILKKDIPFLRLSVTPTIHVYITSRIHIVDQHVIISWGNPQKHTIVI